MTLMTVVMLCCGWPCVAFNADGVITESWNEIVNDFGSANDSFEMFTMTVGRAYDLRDVLKEDHTPFSKSVLEAQCSLKGVCVWEQETNFLNLIFKGDSGFSKQICDLNILSPLSTDITFIPLVWSNNGVVYTRTTGKFMSSFLDNAVALMYYYKHVETIKIHPSTKLGCIGGEILMSWNGLGSIQINGLTLFGGQKRTNRGVCYSSQLFFRVPGDAVWNVHGRKQFERGYVSTGLCFTNKRQASDKPTFMYMMSPDTNPVLTNLPHPPVEKIVYCKNCKPHVSAGSCPSTSSDRFHNLHTPITEVYDFPVHNTKAGFAFHSIDEVVLISDPRRTLRAVQLCICNSHSPFCLVISYDVKNHIANKKHERVTLPLKHVILAAEQFKRPTIYFLTNKKEVHPAAGVLLKATNAIHTQFNKAINEPTLTGIQDIVMCDSFRRSFEMWPNVKRVPACKGRSGMTVPSTRGQMNFVMQKYAMYTLILAAHRH